MPNYPIPDNEADRLAALHRYQILDSLPEQAYDDITRLASQICGTPIALISLVDANRQWFKSKFGLEAHETARDVSFCAHALPHPNELFMVEDATHDERFANNPFVTGAPGVRFYAGAPLATGDGEVLGTLCVIDSQPRELTYDQKESLAALARQVMAQMDLRLTVNGLATQIQARQQVEISLRYAMAETEDLYNNAPCGYQSVDSNGVIVRINNTELQWLGYTREELIGKISIFDLIPPDQHERSAEMFERIKKEGKIADYETEFKRRDGSLLPVLISATAIYGRRGEFISTRSSIFDNTVRKETEKALRETEARFRVFMDNGPFIAFIKDDEGRYVYVNEQMLKRFNRSREEMIGMSAADLVPPEIAAEVRRHELSIIEADRLTTAEETVPTPDGLSHYWLSFRFPLKSSGEKFIGCIAIDITERKFYERQLENYQRQLEEVVAKLEDLAVTDALTGIKNKGAFQNRLNEEWQRARRYNLPMSLLLLDVDFFKKYNDSFGHPAGDEVLKKVAAIMEQQARPSDFVARFGGEEFAIILTNTEIEGAYIVAERLRRAIESATWPHRPVTASIGIASSQPEMKERSELLESADQALYRAKANGRNCVARGAI